MSKENFFKDIPKDISKEILDTIISNETFRLERIVSTGQCSPNDFWYDQNENEWVILLKGNAELEFETEIKKLSPGDYLNIPAHQKHRVKSTSQTEPTIWLAIFYTT
jgi:cupin 2 domain-containing protein